MVGDEVESFKCRPGSVSSVWVYYWVAGDLQPSSILILCVHRYIGHGPETITFVEIVFTKVVNVEIWYWANSSTFL